MILIDVPSRDDRVAEILRDAARYFTDARTRAWTAAVAEIDADLAQRALCRLNHYKTSPPTQPTTWQPPPPDPAASN